MPLANGNSILADHLSRPWLRSFLSPRPTSSAATSPTSRARGTTNLGIGGSTRSGREWPKSFSRGTGFGRSVEKIGSCRMSATRSRSLCCLSHSLSLSHYPYLLLVSFSFSFSLLLFLNLSAGPLFLILSLSRSLFFPGPLYLCCLYFSIFLWCLSLCWPSLSRSLTFSFSFSLSLSLSVLLSISQLILLSWVNYCSSSFGPLSRSRKVSWHKIHDNLSPRLELPFLAGWYCWIIWLGFGRGFSSVRYFTLWLFLPVSYALLTLS